MSSRISQGGGGGEEKKRKEEKKPNLQPPVKLDIPSLVPGPMSSQNRHVSLQCFVGFPYAPDI